MLRSSRARFTYVLTLLVAFAVMLGLGAVVLKQAFLAGTAEAWMMAGILAVVVGLPLAMLLLSVASWLQRQAGTWRIIPDMGENVPGVGQ